MKHVLEHLDYKKLFIAIIVLTVVALAAQHVYTSKTCVRIYNSIQLVNFRGNNSCFSGGTCDINIGARSWKKILVWNSFFKIPLFGLEKGEASFKEYGCPMHDCILTNDSSALKSADAVVFHSFLLGGMPIPHRISPKQIYVFMIFESPLLANQYDWLTGLSNTFNLTASYMKDDVTDIHIPSGAVIPGEVINDEVNKTKLVFWMVSNCQPFSARNEYINELSKYIAIDTYGKCGNTTCPKGDWKCFHNYTREYYFFLAFENSFCDGYISEKIFRALKKPVIPVVLGGGDYNKTLPPHSFINVRDFSGPKALAQYLLYLSETPKEYQEYFKWKQSFSITSQEDERGHGFCKLCEILHDDHYPYKTNFDPMVYWDPKHMCVTGAEEHRILHI